MSIIARGEATITTLFDGEPGLSITEVIPYWLASGLSSGVTHTGAWSTTPTAATEEKPYLWRYEKFIWDDDPNNFTRSQPYIIGLYSKDGAPGDAGRGIGNVKGYYNVNNSPTVPPTTWYDDPQPTTNEAKYLWYYERITYTTGSPAYEDTKKRIIGMYGQSAYEAAVEGGYEGSISDFYNDLGLVDDLESVLENIDSLEENLKTAIEYLEEHGGLLADLINDQTISPSTLVQLRTLLAFIQRESAMLAAKLSNQGELVTTLQDTANAVIAVLETIINGANEADVDFDELAILYVAYLDAARIANEVIDMLLHTRLTDLSAGQIDLIERVGNYEDRLRLLPDEILMTMNGDVAMSLTNESLSFISEEYQTVISKNRWEIMRQQMTMMSITADEMRIPRAISSEYFGVGRIKLVPSYTGGTLVGTDIVFLDSPTGLED